MRHLLLLLPLVALLQPGCKTLDPDEDLPSYLTIDTVHLTIDDPFTQGTASHKITDAWVFLDGDLLGTYEIPFTIPILTGEKSTIRISGGIKMNGIAATRVIYPFLGFYDTTFQIGPMDTITLAPRLSYKEGTDFIYLEDFELVNTLQALPHSDTVVMIEEGPEAFEGLKYGAIYVDNDRPYFIGRTQTGSRLFFPSSSPTAFLELNYKCNIAYYIYFVAEFPGDNVEIPILRVNPNEFWNKLYVNFTPYATAYPGASDYFLVFTVQETGSPGYLFLDNLKIVADE